MHSKQTYQNLKKKNGKKKSFIACATWTSLVCVLTIQLELQQHFPRVFVSKKKKKEKKETQIMKLSQGIKCHELMFGLLGSHVWRCLLLFRVKFPSFFFFFLFCFVFLNDKTTRGKQHMDRRGLLLLNLKHDNNLCAFGILNYFEEKIRLCS